jgi:hypothetical protein
MHRVLFLRYGRGLLSASRYRGEPGPIGRRLPAFMLEVRRPHDDQAPQQL